MRAKLWLDMTREFICMAKEKRRMENRSCPTPDIALQVRSYDMGLHRTITLVNGNINEAKYQDILEEYLWPVIARNFPRGGYFFQDDIAPVHWARSTQEYIAGNGINCLNWLAQSPDINIIENLWLLIKRKLQVRVSFIKSTD
jgi:hypothetical protein